MTRIGSVVAASLVVSGYVTLSIPVPAAPDIPASEYVDARVCASCHRQLAADYRQTGMGRSFFRPSPTNTIENYTAPKDFYHALSGTYYSMTNRDGLYYQRRWQVGFAGA